MKNMKETKFRKFLKEKIKIKAIEYLTEEKKQGSGNTEWKITHGRLFTAFQ